MVFEKMGLLGELIVFFLIVLVGDFFSIGKFY